MDKKKKNSLIVLIIGVVILIVFLILPFISVLSTATFIEYIYALAYVGMIFCPIVIASIALIFLGIRGLLGKDTNKEKEELTIDELKKKQLKWKIVFIVSILPLIIGLGWVIMCSLNKNNQTFLGSHINAFETFLLYMIAFVPVYGVVIVPLLVLAIISTKKFQTFSKRIDNYDRQANYPENSITVGETDDKEENINNNVRK